MYGVYGLCCNALVCELSVVSSYSYIWHIGFWHVLACRYYYDGMVIWFESRFINTDTAAVSWNELQCLVCSELIPRPRIIIATAQYLTSNVPSLVIEAVLLETCLLLTSGPGRALSR